MNMSEELEIAKKRLSLGGKTIRCEKCGKSLSEEEAFIDVWVSKKILCGACLI